MSRLIDADAISYELWTTEVDVDNKRDNYRYFQNRYMVDRRDIESMPTVQQWIPCSEHLPTLADGKDVLVNVISDDRVYDIILADVETVETIYRKGWINAWMKLPPIYKGDDSE